MVVRVQMTRGKPYNGGTPFGNSELKLLILTHLQFAAFQFGKYHNIAVQLPETFFLDQES